MDQPGKSRRVGRCVRKAGLFLMAAATALPSALPAQPEERRAEGRLPSAEAAFIAYGQPTIAIEHVRIVDGTGAAPRSNMTIIVRNGRIAALGPSGESTTPADATVINGTGKTLLPGFVMLHEHLFYPTGNGGIGSYPEIFARLYLAGGETTIRTAGSFDPYRDLAVARAITRGGQIGPDIDVTGPYLDDASERGSDRVSARRDRWPRLVSPADAERIVAYWAEEGATSFKAYDHITRAQLSAAIAAVHARGLRITAHLCSVTAREAAELGIDNIEHGFATLTDFILDKAPDSCPGPLATVRSIAAQDPDGSAVGALIGTLVSRRVALTSTLPILETLVVDRPDPDPSTLAPLSPALLDNFRQARARVQADPSSAVFARYFRNVVRMERRLVRAGGLLVAGSDPTGLGGVVPGASAQRQLRLMVEGGFALPDAVRVMTLNGAHLLGRDHEVGSIAVGRRADLTLFDGDLTRDLSALDRLELVFKAGIGYRAQAIRNAYAGRVGID